MNGVLGQTVRRNTHAQTRPRTHVRIHAHTHRSSYLQIESFKHSTGLYSVTAIKAERKKSVELSKAIVLY